MKKHAVLTLAILIPAALLSVTVAYTTEYNEWTILKTFGASGTPVNGREDAGFRWKWPFPIQQVVRYDARTRILTDDLTELNTEDKQSVIVSIYCAWRIVDPVVFDKNLGTIAAGERAMKANLSHCTREVISRNVLSNLINTDPGKMILPEIEETILAELSRLVVDEYGIKVVSVGVRGLGLPQLVSKTVIEAQKKERETEAETTRSAGEADKEAIIARARSAAEQIKLFAGGRAQEIRTEAYGHVATLYEKFRKYPELAAWLAKVRAMERGLSENAVLYLDATALPGLDLIYKGPAADATHRGAAPAAGGKGSK